jgi:membrane protease YdiL (CAAX protease family)
MKNKIPIRFFVITFLWSWFIWGILIILGQLNSQNVTFTPFGGIDFVLMLLGACGPAVGAIISVYTIEGKSSLKIFFKSFLSLKFGWKVWLSIFFIFGISSMIAWIIPEFFGEERVSTYLPSVFIFPLWIIMVTFIGGGQEEIGWRGYIMPYLEKKFGLIFGGLILGIVWAIWHLPLWFVPGSTQIYVNIIGFAFGTIACSYIFSWIIKESGNRLFSGLIVHGAQNAFAALFPYSPITFDVKLTRYWIYNIII